MFMRLLTSKKGGILSFCDEINETEAGILLPSAKQTLNINHDVDANNGHIRGHISLEYIFEFCRTFESITNL